MKNASGLTLIELLTVIAIICIASTIAIPNIIGWLPNYRLGSAAREVLTTFQQARLAAVKYNAPVHVDFDPDGNGLLDGNYIAFLDDGAGAGGVRGDNIQNGGERTLVNNSLPPGVTMSAGLLWTAFNTTGRASVAGTVTLTNAGGRIRQISVAPGGSSRIL